MASLKVNDRMHLWAKAIWNLCGRLACTASEVHGRCLEFKAFHLKGFPMLDKNFVRENLDFVRERLAARGGKYPLDELVAADIEWKNIILRSEELRKQRNEAIRSHRKAEARRP